MGAGARLGHGVGGAALDRVAAWQLVQPTGDGLVDDGRDRAGVDLILGVDVKAVRQRSTRLADGAGVHGVQEDAGLPAVDEVGVESVSGGVAHGEHPGIVVLGVVAVEHGNVEPEFDEDVWHDVRMGLWAVAAVGVIAHRVGHVSAGAAEVEGFTVPAVREVNAAGEAVIAASEAGKARSDLIRRTVAVPLGDGLGLGGGRQGTKLGVASEHAEVVGELLDGLVGLGTVEVVNLVLGTLRDLYEGAVLRRLEVEFWKPIDGLVGLDVNRAAGGFLKRVKADGGAEGVGADYGVDVTADDAREEDGIEALDDKRSTRVLDEVEAGILAVLSSGKRGD